jgi:hypothetical protein
MAVSIFIGTAKPVRAAGSELKISPSPIQIAAAGPVTLKATITNNTGSTLEAGFTIRKGDSQICATSEVAIPNESSDNISFTYNVSEGEIGTLIWFAVYDTGGTRIDDMMCQVNIIRKELTVGIGASFSVSPDKLAAKDDVLELKFTIENQGEATLTNIAVKIPGVKSGKMLNSTEFTLVAKESKSFSYLYTVTGAATLAPVVTYKVNRSGDTLTYSGITPIDITIEVRDVQMTFKASPTTPQAGETVTFSVEVTNGGNVKYTDLKAYLNGEKVDFPVSTLDAGARKTASYQRSFLASTEVMFELVMKDHTGEIVNISKTVSIELPVDSSVVASGLTMVVDTDTPTITSAGTVKFTGYINNTSEYDFKNLAVTETTQNAEVYNAALLKSQNSTSFEYYLDVGETATYNFRLTVLDSAGDSHTVDAQPVTVTVTSAIATPDYSDAVDVTPAVGEETDDGKTSTMSPVVIIAIALVVLIVGVGVALVVLWRAQKIGGRGKGTGGSRPSSGTPVKKRPSAGPAKRRKPVSRGYRDRNNF